MTTQILSPVELGETSKVGGRLFRKQVLPIGSINYKGRRIDFTRDKLASMADAFRAGAFDSVPLVFADKDNAHTMDPRATTGEMVDVELTENGLVGVFRASDEAARLLESYPRVGVSARILEDYQRADGTHYDAAIQHALITSDPRITGMSPWESVNLSVDVDTTIDLTTETLAPIDEREGVTMATAALTDDELSKLRQVLAAIDTSGTNTGDGDESELTEDELNALAERVFAEQDGGTSDTDPGEQDQDQDQDQEKPAEVAASNTDPAVELANSQVAEMQVQLANMQAQLDERNFTAEKERLARDYGIPPAVVDLARPLLCGSQVIELSNGNNVDAGKVMRDVLTTLGKQYKALDLSSAVGSAFETDGDAQEAAERAEWTKQTRAALHL